MSTAEGAGCDFAPSSQMCGAWWQAPAPCCCARGHRGSLLRRQGALSLQRSAPARSTRCILAHRGHYGSLLRCQGALPLHRSAHPPGPPGASWRTGAIMGPCCAVKGRCPCTEARTRQVHQVHFGAHGPSLVPAALSRGAAPAPKRAPARSTRCIVAHRGHHWSLLRCQGALPLHRSAHPPGPPGASWRTGAIIGPCCAVKGRCPCTEARTRQVHQVHFGAHGPSLVPAALSRGAVPAAQRAPARSTRCIVAHMGPYGSLLRCQGALPLQRSAPARSTRCILAHR